MDWFVPLAVGLFGLLFGSFANVVIWRLPRGESLSTPGSHCPSCETAIGWRDNVPVLSWVMLRGRCRSCAAPISARYPLVELTSGVLWLAMWAVFGPSLALGFAIAFVYLLMILSFIDLDTMRLPNQLVALLAVIGVAGVVVAQITGVLGGPAAARNRIAVSAVGVRRRRARDRRRAAARHLGALLAAAR